MRVTVDPARRRRSRVALLLAATILLVAAEPAHAASRRPALPRPDLELTSAAVSPRVVFQGEPKAQVRFCVEVRNVGRRRSGRIVATMTAEGPGGVSAVIATRSLAPLAPAARPRRGAPLEFDSVSGCERGEASPVTLPLGLYDISVCVSERSGRERRRADNCRARPKHAFIVKRSWNAVVSGQAAAGVLALGFEKWQSNAMVFTFDPAQQVIASGVFGYRLSAGSVTYTDQESATGCQRFGTLTDFAPTGRLTLDYLKGTYEAVGRKQVDFRFPITNVCNDDLEGPVTAVFLDTGIGVAPQPFPFGTPALAGSRGGPADDQNVTWAFS